MRDNCTELRDLAMIDLLASTGMRVGEMVLLNRDDIDFVERECVVLGKGDKERMLSLMQKAIDLSYSELDDLDAIHLLGQGWVAEETLAIAIYCSLKYPKDIERALIAAVNHGGDSDSTGAVTGNILGASLGTEGIPQKFIENLELRDVILEVADDLYNDCKMTEYGDYYDPVWAAKYIKMTYPKVREQTQ